MPKPVFDNYNPAIDGGRTSMDDVATAGLGWERSIGAIAILPDFNTKAGDKG